jgi:hypothetical protein
LPHRDEVAPEIAFLEQCGVSRATLVAATRAAIGGVAPEQALLGQGCMREEDFYRLLAARLGLSYFSGEIAIVAGSDPEAVMQRGVAHLAPNDRGARAVLAPRGRLLTLLVAVFAAGRLPSFYVITSPQTLGIVVRRQFGRQIAERASQRLEAMHPRLAARPLFVDRRIASAMLLACAGLPIAALLHGPFAAFCALILWLAFGASSVLRLLAAAVATRRSATAPPLAEAELPIYSVIAPLRQEARIVPRLIGALEAIDYPKSRLDLKIVIERDDRETLFALAKMKLPAWFEIVLAPPGAPSTKPRALNVALSCARGELVVVYDAEDIPAPDQLRRAAARFARDETLDCLQARLAVYNAGERWISGLFAIEYAGLFDRVNPGLAALGAPIALGGSSNHFRAGALRRAGRWDSWNVTEDADLGLRLARLGMRVGTLDSDTWEEAPSDLGNWFRQRRRWIKGWLQTVAVHGRTPRVLLRELGLRRALAAQALMLGPVLGGLFGPPLAGHALWRVVSGELFRAQTPAEIGFAAMTSVLALTGLAAILVPNLLALRARGWLTLCRSLPLLPVYYCLVSLAAWAALIDLARRPFHWGKTEHGLTRATAPAGLGAGAA